jgi:hypothetical protein
MPNGLRQQSTTPQNGKECDSIGRHGHYDRFGYAALKFDDTVLEVGTGSQKTAARYDSEPNTHEGRRELSDAKRQGSTRGHLAALTPDWCLTCMAPYSRPSGFALAVGDERR